MHHTLLLMEQMRLASSVNSAVEHLICQKFMRTLLFLASLCFASASFAMPTVYQFYGTYERLNGQAAEGNFNGSFAIDYSLANTGINSTWAQYTFLYESVGCERFVNNVCDSVHTGIPISSNFSVNFSGYLAANFDAAFNSAAFGQGPESTYFEVSNSTKYSDDDGYYYSEQTTLALRNWEARQDWVTLAPLDVSARWQMALCRFVWKRPASFR